jgi:hypothetical protein
MRGCHWVCCCFANEELRGVAWVAIVSLSVCLSVCFTVNKHPVLFADPSYRLVCDGLPCIRMVYVEGLLSWLWRTNWSHDTGHPLNGCDLLSPGSVFGCVSPYSLVPTYRCPPFNIQFTLELCTLINGSLCSTVLLTYSKGNKKYVGNFGT